MTANNALAKQVKLFYDVISPYSWVGFEVLCRYRQKWNMDLVLKPFLLGAVVKEAGNSAPMLIKNKGIYMKHDLMRLSKFYNIPINIPKDVMQVMLSKGSLAAQRLITAVQTTHPDKVEEVSREFWMRIWNRDEDICEDLSLKAVLASVGFDDHQIKELVGISKDEATSEKLRRTTREAIDAKAFGAPVILCKDQSGKEHMLFGSDRMELLASLIGETYEGPLTNLSKM